MLKAAVERSSWPWRPIIPAAHRGIWLLLELLVHGLSCSWRNLLTALCHPEFSSTLRISSRAHLRSAKLIPPTSIFCPFLWISSWILQNSDGEWALYQGSYEDEDELNWILLTQNSVSFLIHCSEAAKSLCICELNSLLSQMLSNCLFFSGKFKLKRIYEKRESMFYWNQLCSGTFIFIDETFPYIQEVHYSITSSALIVGCYLIRFTKDDVRTESLSKRGKSLFLK